MQSVSENADSEHADYNIVKWKFIKQSLELESIMTRQMVRLPRRTGTVAPG